MTRDDETGAVRKGGEGRTSVALAYPNRYEVGMSNLGFHALYARFNQRDDTVCERIFLGDAGSVESGRRLAEFDIVAFSVTFELDYATLVRTLDEAGLDVAGERAGRPLVVVGGIAPTLNPEPVAEFADLVFIGEGDDFCDRLVETYRLHGPDELAPYGALPGVYVPSMPGPVTRVWRTEAAADPHRTVIDAPAAVFGDMALVEVGKGCGQHCRFCAAGYAYRPTRYAALQPLLAAIDEGLDRKGKVGLVGSAIGDHPDAEAIFAHIVQRGGRFSVSSLRMDKLTDPMIDALAAGGCHTLTFAPEAGAEPLRRRINKLLPDAAILDCVARCAARHPFDFKFYFLAGLPGESLDDVAAIPALVGRIRETMIGASRARGTMGNIVAGIDLFVPKPFTPFQREPFVGVAEGKRRLNVVKKGLGGLPNVTVQAGSAREAAVQALLSVGDRTVAELIRYAALHDGDWWGGIKGLGMAGRIEQRFAPEEPLPWGFVDHGLRDGYLEKEARLAEKEKTTPECPTPREPCERCGSFPGACIEVTK